jgi:hypothetical protein
MVKLKDNPYGLISNFTQLPSLIASASFRGGYLQMTGKQQIASREHFFVFFAAKYKAAVRE